MSASTAKSHCKAFTLVELIVVIAIFAVLVALILPEMGGKKDRRQLVCMVNLKQLGIGLIMYSGDHTNQLPWNVSTNTKGGKMVAEIATAADCFSAITNYVQQPRLFVCPTDKARQAATNFAGFSNSNLSYFVSLDASLPASSSPSLLILSGDRHLSVDNQPVKPGLCTVELNSTIGWTRELHQHKSQLPSGSLLFADGHTESVSSKILPAKFNYQSITASRLLIP